MGRLNTHFFHCLSFFLQWIKSLKIRVSFIAPPLIKFYFVFISTDFKTHKYFVKYQTGKNQSNATAELHIIVTVHNDGRINEVRVKSQCGKITYLNLSLLCNFIIYKYTYLQPTRSQLKTFLFCLG